MRRILAVIALALLAWGCKEPSPPPPPTAAYAGSASCAECHAQAYDEWKGSHHAGAQRLLDDKLDRQAFEPAREIRHASQKSYAEIRDGKYTLTTMGRDSQPHPFVPVEALGVYPLWQYLIPAEGGRLQVTELAFDPDKKEWFNVYNDEDRKGHEWGHWSNRGMNWNSMCATCHTTAFQKNYQSASDSYASKYLERGVGCEQCHGPMQAHVDWQRQNKDQPGDPTLVKTTWPQYFSTCAACHSRRSDLTGNFKPGDNYFDHYDLVLPDLSNTFYPDGQNWDEDFEISAFTTSYMHAGGIRCLDCHSPHTGKRKTDGDGLCMRCHAQPVTTKIAITPEHSHHPIGKGGSFCVDCHMPQTPYMARHLRRDHGMTIPDPLLTKEHGIPNACNRCHQDKTVDWSLQYMDEWYGRRMERPTRTRAQLLARVKAGDLSAVPDLLAFLRQEKNPSWRAIGAKFLMAVVDSGAGDLSAATIESMLGMLQDETPVSQAAAVETLDAFLSAGLPDALAARVTAAIRPLLTSGSRLVRVKSAWALRRELPADSPARQELLASIRYSEDQPLGAFRWAQFLVDTGKPQEALPWYEKAVQWDPNSAAFRHAYATVLDALGRPEEALTHAAKAVELEPDQAIHRYALGLLYGAVNNFPEAREALKAAVEREAREPRYWYNLASVETRLGEFDAAVSAISKAEDLAPTVVDYTFARAQILLAAGRQGDARAAVESVLHKAPGHSEARQLLMQLEAQSGLP